MHRPLARRAARASVLAAALLATVALGDGAAALQGQATPTPAPAPSASATPPGAEASRPGKGPKAGKGSGRGRGPVPEVAFTCDPSRTHGQNVSAYVHSLPKGQGRGRQVSEVARSDCGKDR